MLRPSRGLIEDPIWVDSLKMQSLFKKIKVIIVIGTDNNYNYVHILRIDCVISNTKSSIKCSSYKMNISIDHILKRHSTYNSICILLYCGIRTRKLSLSVERKIKP